MIARDLPRWDSAQRALWEACRISPRIAPLRRYGKVEHVFVVAERSGEAIYWEDVEEGFNVSPIGTSGEILEHWCNQDTLAWALNRWLAPERVSPRAAPAEAVGE
jgi:hypothetical protein